MTPREGTYLSLGYGGVFGLKDPAHPSAAKLFINWLLMKEAQTLYSRAMGNPSLREDVPIEHIPEILLRKPGMKLHDGNSEEFTLSLPKRYREAREIFGHLIR